MSHPAILRLEQVSLKAAVGPRYLLQDISFDLYPGDRLAIVGPSGAGKTFLLRLINRLSEVSQGKIYFDNQDIRQIPVLQLRQQVTLVPQEPKLLDMTVREALAYPLVLRGFDRATIQQRLNTWAEQLHLSGEWLDRTETQLSVGQRQLVSIARALMIQPKVLLLDEPTSALDVGRGDNLLSLLHRLTEGQAMTILMVSHQLELVQQFCHRLLYLHQGKITQDLPVAQVDWLHLKQDLIEAEAQEAQEWE